MNRHHYCWMLLAVVLLLAGCQNQSDSAARNGSSGEGNEPSEYAAVTNVARQVVEAWQNKNFDALFALTQQEVPEEIRERFQPGGEGYQEMTSEDEFRWRAVRDWDGTFPSVRVHQRMGIIIGKRQRENPDPLSVGPATEMIMVNLVREDGRWKYADMYFPDEEELEFQEYSNRNIVPSGMSKASGDEADPVNLLHVLAGAFRDKDLETIKPLVMRELLEDYQRRVAEAAENSSVDLSPDDHLSMLSSWEGGAHQDLMDWDGEILDSRMLKEAWVTIGGEGDEVYVVELLYLDGRWVFSDVLSPLKQDYEHWGQELAAQ